MNIRQCTKCCVEKPIAEFAAKRGNRTDQLVLVARALIEKSDQYRPRPRVDYLRQVTK
jgi:hypothetical protein